MFNRLLALTFVFAASAFAQVEFTKAEDIDYVGDGNPRQMLDFYLPKEKTEKPLPVLLWIHGWAWLQGSKKNPGLAWRAFQLGPCAVVSINYRLTREAKWPAQIHDCKASLRWVRAHAGKYNLDPDRIVVWGASAGGHLVALLGTTENDEALDGELGPHEEQSTGIKAVINFFGPTDFPKMNSQGSSMNHNDRNSPEGKLLGGIVSELPQKAKLASALYHVSKDDAPVLTVHGTKDRLVPYKQGLDFDRKLDEALIPSILLTVEGGGHGQGFGESVQKTIEKFLQDHLFGKKNDLRDATVKKNL